MYTCVGVGVGHRTHLWSEVGATELLYIVGRSKVK